MTSWVVSLHRRVRRVLSAAGLPAVLIGACLTPSLQAAEHWIRLAAPHFEMYTTNDEKQGTEALKFFEQVRYFFLQNSPSKTAPDTPVRIVAFKSEKEYRPYRLNEGAFAYFTRSRKRDYIVMEDLGPEHDKAAVHEYTHLIVQHLGLKLPVWLSEGMADLYSSLEPMEGQALIGRPLPEREATLSREKWLDLDVLFAVDQDSPFYNERNKMSIFYAQSWGLTHMLMLGETYGPHFSQFLSSIARGRSAAECFQAVYGKDLAHVSDDLHSYLRRSTMRGALFPVKLATIELRPEISNLPPLSINLALADLLAAQKRTFGEAETRLSQLERENPVNPEIQESLGYLRWQAGDDAQALQHFTKAAEQGSNDPDMLFHYSQLLYDSGAPPTRIIEELQKVLALKPDYYEARFNLGMMAMNAREWNVAYDAFSHIKTVEPERAFSFFSALAHCLLNLHEIKQAEDTALRAKQYAVTPDQQLQISKLNDYLNHVELESQPAPQQSTPTSRRADGETQTINLPEISDDSPRQGLLGNVPDLPDTRRVEGTAQSFDCTVAGYRLHLKVADREMVFQIRRPGDILLRNRAPGTFNPTCGGVKPFKVTVEYIPSSQTPSVDGEVRELIF